MSKVLHKEDLRNSILLSRFGASLDLVFICIRDHEPCYDSFGPQS